MMKLRDVLEILPKYQRTTPYGKKGDVKGVSFSYAGRGNLSYDELSQELIDNTMVKEITPIGSSHYNYCTLSLWVSCVDIREIDEEINIEKVGD